MTTKNDNTIFIRDDHTTDYFCASTLFIRDKNLTPQAKGVFAYMLSCKDDWVFSIEGMASVLNCGVRLIKSALNNLEDNGYIRRQQRKEPGTNKFLPMQYTIIETPAEKAEKKANNDTARLEVKKSMAEEAGDLDKVEEINNQIKVIDIRNKIHYEEVNEILGEIPLEYEENSKKIAVFR